MASVRAWLDHVWLKLRRMDYWSPNNPIGNTAARIYRARAPGLGGHGGVANLSKVQCVRTASSVQLSRTLRPALPCPPLSTSRASTRLDSLASPPVVRCLLVCPLSSSMRRRARRPSACDTTTATRCASTPPTIQIRRSPSTTISCRATAVGHFGNKTYGTHAHMNVRPVPQE